MPSGHQENRLSESGSNEAGEVRVGSGDYYNLEPKKAFQGRNDQLRQGLLRD